MIGKLGSTSIKLLMINWLKVTSYLLQWACYYALPGNSLFHQVRKNIDLFDVLNAEYSPYVSTVSDKSLFGTSTYENFISSKIYTQNLDWNLIKMKWRIRMSFSSFYNFYCIYFLIFFLNYSWICSVWLKTLKDLIYHTLYITICTYLSIYQFFYS